MGNSNSNPFEFVETGFETLVDPLVSVGSNVPFIGETVKTTGSSLAEERKKFLSRQGKNVKDVVNKIPNPIIYDPITPKPRTQTNEKPTKLNPDLSPTPSQPLTPRRQLPNSSGLNTTASYGGELNNINTNSNLKTPNTNTLPQSNTSQSMNQYIYPALIAGGLFIIYEKVKK